MDLNARRIPTFRQPRQRPGGFPLRSSGPRLTSQNPSVAGRSDPRQPSLTVVWPRWWVAGLRRSMVRIAWQRCRNHQCASQSLKAAPKPTRRWQSLFPTERPVINRPIGTSSIGSFFATPAPVGPLMPMSRSAPRPGAVRAFSPLFLRAQSARQFFPCGGPAPKPQSSLLGFLRLLCGSMAFIPQP